MNPGDFELFVVQQPRIQFGFGAIRTLPAELGILGIKRPLIVTDKGLAEHGVFDQARRALPANADIAVCDDTPENPTIAGVERALNMYREKGCDGIVALGGGSVIDSAKALSVAATHSGPLTEYFRREDKIGAHTAKLIAIPTTAGTGSETSSGAGIHPDAKSRGSGLNSPFIVPKVAICDPDLTLTLPRHLTAGTGMDALTHAVEGFLAKGDNVFGEAIALDSVRRVFAWIERAVDDGNNREARWHMMMASLEAMMPLKGLGPAHALANMFGDQGLHHGMMVTIAMPAVLRRHETRIAEKMRKLAEAMPLKRGQAPSDAVAEMNARVGLAPNIRALGYRGGDLDEMAEDAFRSFFNARAPYHPTKNEYKDMIREALG